jgi:repressor of nif and glnA expression
MSQLMSKVEKILGKVQGASGLQQQTMGPVLQRLGEIQALIDSYSNTTLDPQRIQQLQTQMAAIRLDDKAVSDVLAALRQAKAAERSITLKEKDVAKLLKDLMQVQSQMTAPGLSSAMASANMTRLQQLFGRAESMIASQLDSLQLGRGKLLKMLQKLQ